MKSAVIIFPGSNCDYDAYFALKDIDKNGQVDFIWHDFDNVKKLFLYDLIILPGGFSYGDYLRPGAIAHFAKVMDGIKDYVEKEKGLILGICNGFQILVETGLLPGVLQRNKTLSFICKYIYLKTENTNLPFTKNCSKGRTLKMPIAHGDGNYFCDQNTLRKLTENKQIVFKYCSEKGELNEDANPNGSLENIAGICNNKFNVLGMMPHPERCTKDILGSSDGKYIFESIKKWLN
jgi:phosphoribosylformylglycinamidine synthase